MKLQHETKADKSIYVNGTVYQVDAEGCVEVNKKADAAKLLGMPGWVEASQAGANHRQSARPQPRKGGVALINSVGAPVPGQKGMPEPEKTLEPVPQDPESGGQEGDAEWPHPTEDMDLDYLKEMADAYEVSYGRNIGAKTLVKRIEEAMYE